MQRMLKLSICLVGLMAQVSLADTISTGNLAGREIEPGTVIALNNEMTVGDSTYAAAQELIVGEEGELYKISANGEDVEDIGLNINAISPRNVTVLTEDKESGGLTPFNIPDDFEVAGGGGHRHRRTGVTNCYHVAKAVLARKIHLTGNAAYMAAPQLRRAHWIRYSYAQAPRESACVFGAGGERTASGGARYGHIGIKGHGGIINPEIGFELHRPFLGCFAPPGSHSIAML
jgi:hypothetical protein